MSSLIRPGLSQSTTRRPGRLGGAQRSRRTPDPADLPSTSGRASETEHSAPRCYTPLAVSILRHVARTQPRIARSCPDSPHHKNPFDNRAAACRYARQADRRDRGLVRTELGVLSVVPAFITTSRAACGGQLFRQTEHPTGRLSTRPIVDNVGDFAGSISCGPWPGFVQSRYIAAEVMV
jgi:hypothetical protein